MLVRYHALSTNLILPSCNDMLYGTLNVCCSFQGFKVEISYLPVSTGTSTVPAAPYQTQPEVESNQK